MSDSVLLPIPSDRIDLVWKDALKYLESAVDSTRGRLNLMDAYKFIREKDWVLWVSIRDKKIEAIAITEILTYPNRKICSVRALSGENYANWAKFEEQIAAWAKSIGCDGMEALARKGWAKVFTQYECTHVFLERKF